MGQEVRGVYFSPTHTTKRVVEALVGELAAQLGRPEGPTADLTRPLGRARQYEYAPDDVVVVGVPVYGGRVPALVTAPLQRLAGNGAAAVAVVVYGNRAYEDALPECASLLRQAGFTVVAGCAFIGEHSLTSRVGRCRPDTQDLSDARDFAGRIAGKLLSGDRSEPDLGGDGPFQPWSAGPDVYPATSDICVRCGQCAMACPVGIIRSDRPAEPAPGCLRCCACIKCCPVGARSFPQPMVCALVQKLETYCMQRKEPELFC